MKAKFTDSTYSHDASRGGGMRMVEDSGVCKLNDRPWSSVDGLVQTRHGLVSVSAYTYGKTKSSNLYMIVDGREYWRAFHNKAYTQRGLVTKAKQFAEEIVATNQSN